MKLLAAFFVFSLLFSAAFALEKTPVPDDKGGAAVLEPSEKQELEKENSKTPAGAAAAAAGAGGAVAHGAGHKGGAAHWGYEKEGNDWADHHKMCGGPEQQSPIDLKKFSNEAVGAGKPIQLNYKMAKGRKFKNNGHTWQADGDFGYVMLNGKKYNTVQFHFHWKSEHTVEGAFQDAEIHMVHQWDGVPIPKRLPNGFDDLLVTGFFIKSGAPADHAFFASLGLAKGPKEPNTTSATPFDVDAAQLFTKDMKYYTYPGSLTTPGCNPTVTWHVFSEMLPISKTSYKAFVDAFSNKTEFPKGNRRAVQKRLTTTKVETNKAVLGSGAGSGAATPSPTSPSAPSTAPPAPSPAKGPKSAPAGALNP